MISVVGFLKENFRFALAMMANVLAFAVSVWWFFDSNWNTSNPVQIEPLVACISLCATLLGLNFVNNKLTKPHLKVSLSMALANDPIRGPIKGINVSIENHSILKSFIRSFQVLLPGKGQVVQFLYDGFSGEPLPKVVLEPGQSFSFYIVKENLRKAPQEIAEYGDFVVTTDIGYKFIIPAKKFREHFAFLMSSEDR